jgi:hypothetical protein
MSVCGWPSPDVGMPAAPSPPQRVESYATPPHRVGRLDGRPRPTTRGREGRERKVGSCNLARMQRHSRPSLDSQSSVPRPVMVSQGTNSREAIRNVETAFATSSCEVSARPANHGPRTARPGRPTRAHVPLLCRADLQVLYNHGPEISAFLGPAPPGNALKWRGRASGRSNQDNRVPVRSSSRMHDPPSSLSFSPTLRVDSDAEESPWSFSLSTGSSFTVAGGCALSTFAYTRFASLYSSSNTATITTTPSI